MANKTFEVYFDYADRCVTREYDYGTPYSKINADYQEWKNEQMGDVRQGWCFRGKEHDDMVDYTK